MNVAFRIFYVINAKINIYFLKNRQHYFVFVGHKPLSVENTAEPLPQERLGRRF